MSFWGKWVQKLREPDPVFSDDIPTECPYCGSGNAILFRGDVHYKDGRWRGSAEYWCQGWECGKEYKWKRD
ncbi:MAG TPA: hypothetical protein DCE18_14600 [Syntrophobacteraceae bacterium]|jgi:hypothetical protein|nr:hypothetical protein [Syntrophobacteraceae bacterium]